MWCLVERGIFIPIRSFIGELFGLSFCMPEAHRAQLDMRAWNIFPVKYIIFRRQKFCVFPGIGIGKGRRRGVGYGGRNAVAIGAEIGESLWCRGFADREQLARGWLGGGRLTGRLATFLFDSQLPCPVARPARRPGLALAGSIRGTNRGRVDLRRTPSAIGHQHRKLCRIWEEFGRRSHVLIYNERLA